jgi:sporulation protein YqfC
LLGEGNMSKFNNFRSKLADELEIPNNALSDNFDLRMHGNKKVIIENHLGITIYEDNMVNIKTNEQNITIKGSKFKIEEINNYKVIVKGNIKEIIFSMKE